MRLQLTFQATVHKEVSLIFRWLEVLYSLSPPDDFELSDYEEVRASVHPTPRETEAGEYEVNIPTFPWACWGVQMTGE